MKQMIKKKTKLKMKKDQHINVEEAKVVDLYFQVILKL
jgi:hypothetical protein